MSKVFYLIFSSIFSIILVILSTSPAYALDACNSIQITLPVPLILPLYSNTPRATFTLSVGGTNVGPSGYQGWKIGFPGCNSVVPLDASVQADGRSISKEVENSTFLRSPYFSVTDTNCTFAAGPHKLTATAVRNDGSEVNICEASYRVEDANAQCNLTITPDKGITPANTILVSGTGLVPRGTFNPAGYGLFMDNQLIGSNVDTRNSSTFAGFQIPPANLTLGLHQVDLRYPTITGVDPYGSPLCNISFTVGPSDKPGSVVGGGTGGSAKSCTGEGCTSGGGSGCDNDKNNPGIKTAIGCIHTSPVGFIKDFLKFILGISGGLAFLMMLLGAFQMLTSAGNPDTLVAGRERLTSAIIGLLFVIFAVLLLQIIGFDILKIEGFGRGI